VPTYESDWTENLSLHASSSIANGANEVNDLDLAGSGYYGAIVQVDIDIPSGSPAGDVTVEVFRSADGGTSVDTIPAQKVALPFTTTGNKKQSIVVDGPWNRVKVSNGTGATLTYVGRWAGLKQVSA